MLRLRYALRSYDNLYVITNVILPITRDINVISGGVRFEDVVAALHRYDPDRFGLISFYLTLLLYSESTLLESSLLESIIYPRSTERYSYTFRDKSNLSEANPTVT